MKKPTPSYKTEKNINEEVTKKLKKLVDADNKDPAKVSTKFSKLVKTWARDYSLLKNNSDIGIGQIVNVIKEGEKKLKTIDISVNIKSSFLKSLSKPRRIIDFDLVYLAKRYNQALQATKVPENKEENVPSQTSSSLADNIDGFDAEYLKKIIVNIIKEIKENLSSLDSTERHITFLALTSLGKCKDEEISKNIFDLLDAQFSTKAVLGYENINELAQFYINMRLVGNSLDEHDEHDEHKAIKIIKIIFSELERSAKNNVAELGQLLRALAALLDEMLSAGVKLEKEDKEKFIDYLNNLVFSDDKIECKIYKIYIEQILDCLVACEKRMQINHNSNDKDFITAMKSLPRIQHKILNAEVEIEIIENKNSKMLDYDQGIKNKYKNKIKFKYDNSKKKWQYHLNSKENKLNHSVKEIISKDIIENSLIFSKLEEKRKLSKNEVNHDEHDDIKSLLKNGELNQDKEVANLFVDKLKLSCSESLRFIKMILELEEKLGADIFIWLTNFFFEEKIFSDYTSENPLIYGLVDLLSEILYKNRSTSLQWSCVILLGKLSILAQNNNDITIKDKIEYIFFIRKEIIQHQIKLNTYDHLWAVELDLIPTKISNTNISVVDPIKKYKYIIETNKRLEKEKFEIVKRVFEKTLPLEYKIEQMWQQTETLLEDNAEISDALSFYIPPNGVNSLEQLDMVSRTEEDLEDTVNAVLGLEKTETNSNNLTQISAGKSDSLILLQGRPGSGKSLFVLSFVKRLWQQYKRGAYIPLFINMRLLEDPNKKCIEQALTDFQFGKYEIEELKKSNGKKEYKQFVIILDGYDELPHPVDIYRSNDLESWNAKTIVTCRIGYLKNDYQNRFISSDGKLPIELFMAPFNEAKRRDFIAKNLTSGKKSQYLNLIEQLPSFIDKLSHEQRSKILSEDLEKINSKTLEKLATLLPETIIILQESFKNFDKEFKNLNELIKKINVKKEMLESLRIDRKLIESPFILKTLLEVLDEIINEDKEVEITRTYIFEKFTAFIHQKGASKYKTSPNLVAKYSKSLAITMLADNDRSIIPNTKQKYSIKKNDTYKKYLAEDPDTTSQRQAAPLIISNRSIQFIHKSLQDYYAALCLFDEINFNKEISEIEYFASINLTDRYEVLSFLKEMIMQEAAEVVENYNKHLFKMLNETKTKISTTHLAANAITLLVFMRVPFSGLVLNNVNMSGADANGIILHNTKLIGAKCSNMRLTNAWLHNTDLTKASLENIIFGQKPPLEHEKPVKQIVFDYLGRNEQIVATVSGAVVYLWQASTGQRYHTTPDLSVLLARKLKTPLNRKKMFIRAVHFIDTDQLICVIGNAITYYQYQKNTYKLEILMQLGEEITSVAFSPDGSMLAIGIEDKEQYCIKVFTVDALEFNLAVKQLINKTVDNKINSLEFSNNNNYLAISFLEKIELYQLTCDIYTKEIDQNESYYCFKEEGVGQYKLKYIDKENITGQIITANIGSEIIKNEDFAKDDKLSSDIPKERLLNYIKILSIDPLFEQRFYKIKRLVFDSNNTEINGMTHSTNSDLAGCFSSDNMLWLFNKKFTSKTPTLMLQRFDNRNLTNKYDSTHLSTSDVNTIKKVRYSPDGKYLVAVTTNSTVIVWNTEIKNKHYLVFIDNSDHGIENLNFSPDSFNLAWSTTSEKEHVVYLRDITSLRQTHLERPSHRGKITGFTFDKKSHVLTSFADDQDNPVLQWEIKTGKPTLNVECIVDNERVMTDEQVEDELKQKNNGVPRVLFVRQLHKVEFHELSATIEQEQWSILKKNKQLSIAEMDRIAPWKAYEIKNNKLYIKKIEQNSPFYAVLSKIDETQPDINNTIKKLFKRHQLFNNHSEEKNRSLNVKPSININDERYQKSLSDLNSFLSNKKPHDTSVQNNNKISSLSEKGTEANKTTKINSQQSIKLSPNLTMGAAFELEAGIIRTYIFESRHWRVINDEINEPIASRIVFDFVDETHIVTGNNMGIIRCWELDKSQKWQLRWCTGDVLFAKNCQIRAVEHLSDANHILLKKSGAKGQPLYVKDNFDSDNPDFLMAVANGDEKEFDKLLLELNEHEVNVINKIDDKTALHLAAQFGNLHAVDKLLEKKANFTLIDNRGKVAGNYVYTSEYDNQNSKNREKILEILPALDEKYPEYNFFHMAIHERNLKKLEFLIAALQWDCISESLPQSMDLNGTTADGKTPLYLAIEENFITAVAMLLNAGADPTIPAGSDEKLQTSVLYLAMQQDCQLIDINFNIAKEGIPADQIKQEWEKAARPEQADEIEENKLFSDDNSQSVSRMLIIEISTDVYYAYFVGSSAGKIDRFELSSDKLTQIKDFFKQDQTKKLELPITKKCRRWEVNFLDSYTASLLTLSKIKLDLNFGQGELNAAHTTPLHFAIGVRSLVFVKKLLSYYPEELKLNFNAKNEQNQTAFYLAIQKFKEAIESIVEHPSFKNINLADNGYLHCAVSYDNDEAAKLLLSYSNDNSLKLPININEVYQNETALHLAIKNGEQKEKILQTILSVESPHISKLNLRSEQVKNKILCRSLLHYAIECNNFPALTSLLNKELNEKLPIAFRVNINYAENGKSFLIFAIEKINDYDFFKKYILNDELAVFHQLDLQAKELFNFVFEKGGINLAKLLLSPGLNKVLSERQINLNSSLNNSQDPLLVVLKAAFNETNLEKKEELEKLVEALVADELMGALSENNKPNFQAMTEEKNTALHLTVMCGFFNTVKQLLKYKADYTSVNLEQLTPFHISCQNLKKAPLIFNEFIAHLDKLSINNLQPLDFNNKQHKFSILHKLAEEDILQLNKILIAIKNKSAEAESIKHQNNIVNCLENGKTILHLVSNKDDFPTFELLIDFPKIDLNIVSDKETALHMLIQKSKTVYVEALLNKKNIDLDLTHLQAAYNAILSNNDKKNEARQIFLLVLSKYIDKTNSISLEIKLSEKNELVNLIRFCAQFENSDVILAKILTKSNSTSLVKNNTWLSWMIGADEKQNFRILNLICAWADQQQLPGMKLAFEAEVNTAIKKFVENYRSKKQKETKTQSSNQSFQRSKQGDSSDNNDIVKTDDEVQKLILRLASHAIKWLKEQHNLNDPSSIQRFKPLARGIMNWINEAQIQPNGIEGSKILSDLIGREELLKELANKTDSSAIEKHLIDIISYLRLRENDDPNVCEVINKIDKSKDFINNDWILRSIADLLIIQYDYWEINDKTPLTIFRNGNGKTYLEWAALLLTNDSLDTLLRQYANHYTIQTVNSLYDMNGNLDSTFYRGAPLHWLIKQNCLEKNEYINNCIKLFLNQKKADPSILDSESQSSFELALEKNSAAKEIIVLLVEFKPELLTERYVKALLRAINKNKISNSNDSKQIYTILIKKLNDVLVTYINMPKPAENLSPISSNTEPDKIINLMIADASEDSNIKQDISLFQWTIKNDEKDIFKKLLESKRINEFVLQSAMSFAYLEKLEKNDYYFVEILQYFIEINQAKFKNSSLIKVGKEEIDLVEFACFDESRFKLLDKLFSIPNFTFSGKKWAENLVSEKKIKPLSGFLKWCLKNYKKVEFTFEEIEVLFSVIKKLVGKDKVEIAKDLIKLAINILSNSAINMPVVSFKSQGKKIFSWINDNNLDQGFFYLNSLDNQVYYPLMAREISLKKLDKAGNLGEAQQALQFLFEIDKDIDPKIVDIILALKGKKFTINTELYENLLMLQTRYWESHPETNPNIFDGDESLFYCIKNAAKFVSSGLIGSVPNFTKKLLKFQREFCVKNPDSVIKEGSNKTMLQWFIEEDEAGLNKLLDLFPKHDPQEQKKWLQTMHTPILNNMKNLNLILFSYFIENLCKYFSPKIQTPYNFFQKQLNTSLETNFFKAMITFNDNNLLLMLVSKIKDKKTVAKYAENLLVLFNQFEFFDPIKPALRYVVDENDVELMPKILKFSFSNNMTTDWQNFIFNQFFVSKSNNARILLLEKLEHYKNNQSVNRFDMTSIKLSLIVNAEDCDEFFPDKVIYFLFKLGAWEFYQSSLSSLGWFKVYPKVVLQSVIEYLNKLDSLDGVDKKFDGKTLFEWAIDSKIKKNEICALIKISTSAALKNDSLPILHKIIITNDVNELEKNPSVCLKSSDLNKPFLFGFTPLHWAVIIGSEEIVKILVKNNANKDLKDSQGWKPLQWAKHLNFSQIEKILPPTSRITQVKDTFTEFFNRSSSTKPNQASADTDKNGLDSDISTTSYPSNISKVD